MIIMDSLFRASLSQTHSIYSFAAPLPANLFLSSLGRNLIDDQSIVVHRFRPLPRHHHFHQTRLRARAPTIGGKGGEKRSHKKVMSSSSEF